MQPLVLTIAKRDIAQWVGALLESGKVIAPVRGPCGEAAFCRIESPEEPLWEFENPLAPPKQFLLPQTDPIVAIRRNGGVTTVAPIYDDAPRILLNVRPCDVRGIAFLTRMHEMEPADASYLRRRANFTLIALACHVPCRLGFCVCSDSGPFLSGGYDVQLTDLGERYLAETGSEKGEAAIGHASGLFRPASEEEVAQRQRLETVARGRFGDQTCHFASAMRRISTRRVDDALWEQMGDWCLECGGCNFICPTCYCFSVKDRGGDGRWTRCRMWDSCQYGAFTLEASGHNPRAQRGERMKRRFFHKVSAQYYVRDGATGCVGCGRCIKVCLGGTDMPAVVAAIRRRAWHEQ
ncbi:MAG: 4Fe-4S dicluster domain-containing protein [Bryobacteraceae bacterium]|nr:4Fe-4S dicluster domain-containing protein [Bryobacteraceae bacterium]